MIGIFILLELLLAFITGFLNLLGASSSLSVILILIFNIVIFFIFAFKNGKTTNKKGLIEGILTGAVFILILLVFSVILMQKKFTFGTLIYYLILLCTSIIGATFGKNKQIDSKKD